MATSFQAFPPPGTVYPTGESDPGSAPYHSSGSYGTVFVVLAVIVVVSAVACVLGRFCGKRSSGQPKAKKSKHQSDGRAHGKAHSSNGRSKGRDVELGFGPKGPEIDFGFEKKIPKVKVAPNGYGHGKQGQRPPQNGPGQFNGHPMGQRQLPMMECPRNF